MLLTIDAIQWGPIVTVLLSAGIAMGGFFVRTVSKTLNDHGTALAVLVSETRPGLKLQDEVLDLKLASAELNAIRIDIEKRVTSLERNRENKR